MLEKFLVGFHNVMGTTTGGSCYEAIVWPPFPGGLWNGMSRNDSVSVNVEVKFANLLSFRKRQDPSQAKEALKTAPCGMTRYGSCWV